MKLTIFNFFLFFITFFCQELFGQQEFNQGFFETDIEFTKRVQGHVPHI